MKQRTNLHGFTLIELLVVIAIIAILGGLLLPAVTKVRQKGYETKARTEVKSLEVAVKQYMNEYGRFPFGSGRADVTIGRADNYGGDNNAELIRVLRALSGDGNPNHANNPRRLSFLDVNEEGLDPAGNFVDPWGNQYIVVMDTNFDNELRFPGGLTGLAELKGRNVAVFSLGPRGRKDFVDSFITSWK